MDVRIRELLAGEDLTFDRAWGGPMVKKIVLAADGQIGAAGPCIYYGHFVTTALGAGVLNVRDATTAGTGDIVDVIASAAAQGVKNLLPFGIYCPAGAYADFTAAGGSVTFFYQQL
jgi:hypothetical protein